MYKLVPVWKNLINIGPLTIPRDVPSRLLYNRFSGSSSSSSSSVPPLASVVRLCWRTILSSVILTFLSLVILISPLPLLFKYYLLISNTETVNLSVHQFQIASKTIFKKIKIIFCKTLLTLIFFCFSFIISHTAQVTICRLIINFFIYFKSTFEVNVNRLFLEWFLVDFKCWLWFDLESIILKSKITHHRQTETAQIYCSWVKKKS